MEQEPEHRVLAPPHVPAAAAARVFAVVAEITVRQLRRQQVGDGRLDVRAQTRVARHVRERRGRVHVLAPELGLPIHLLRAPAVWIGEVDSVRLHHVVLDAAAQARADIPVEADVPQVRQRVLRRKSGANQRRQCRCDCRLVHLLLSFLCRSRLQLSQIPPPPASRSRKPKHLPSLRHTGANTPPPAPSSTDKHTYQAPSDPRYP